MTLLNRREAAAIAGVQPATIDQWVRRGKLSPAATGPVGSGRSLQPAALFRRSDVLRLVDREPQVHPGPTCPTCGVTEARCAYTYPCCVECGHWPDLDAHGNPVRKTPETAGHGTDSRYRLGCRCDSCRLAHRVTSQRGRRQQLRVVG